MAHPQRERRDAQAVNSRPHPNLVLVPALTYLPAYLLLLLVRHRRSFGLERALAGWGGLKGVGQGALETRQEGGRGETGEPRERAKGEKAEAAGDTRQARRLFLE